MRSEATRAGETSVGEQVLYMVLELSERSWKVLFASAAGRRRERAVAGRDVAGLLEEIAVLRVEHALVMAHAEWGDRRRRPARIGGGRQGVPAHHRPTPRDDRATHPLALERSREDRTNVTSSETVLQITRSLTSDAS